MLSLVGALVVERNTDSRVQECQFPQALSEDVILESSRFGENLRVRLKAYLGTGFLGLADYTELAGRFALAKAHLVDLAVFAHFGLEPFRNGVDALGSDPVQATGYLVSALAELASRVEVG